MKGFFILFGTCVLFLLSQGCGNGKSDESSNDTINYDSMLSIAEEEEEVEDYDSALMLKYQPRLKEYVYTFNRKLIEESAEKTKGDWVSEGFTSTGDAVMSSMAGAQYDGIDVGDKYGEDITSKLYDLYFRNQTKDSKEYNRSIRLNIFRHPESGMPMLAINGKLVNCNRMNINPHQNGKKVEMSFQCIKDHPVLALDGVDKKYPWSIHKWLFLYVTDKPFYWYPRELKDRIDCEMELDVLPEGYSEDEMHYVNSMIREYEQEPNRDYYSYLRKKESIDPKNNDYDKYFYIDLTFYNCDSDPCVALNFDGRDFALVCSNNRKSVSPIPLSDLKKIERNVWGNYGHKVVANNQVVDPYNVEGSVRMSNVGAYGKHVAANENVVLGWDTYVDGVPYGRIFEAYNNSNGGYKFNLFRNGNPYEIEIIDFGNLDNFNGEVILTTRRRAGHLKKIN